jgi:hypothetical protein
MPFKSALCNAPTADQSLTSGFPHNKRGKGRVFGSHCAVNCALDFPIQNPPPGRSVIAIFQQGRKCLRS